MSKNTKYVFINYLLPLILLSQNLQVNNLQANNSHINKDTIIKIAAINNILEYQNLTTKEPTCPEKQNPEANYLQKNNSETKIINSNVACLEGPQLIYGIKLFAKDQVLLTGQIDKEENGLWIVQDKKWVLLRQGYEEHERAENKNSIETDLEFAWPNEQNYTTKAGGNVTTAQDFTAETNIIKTASTGVDVVQSSVTIDNSNNISGINTISVNSFPLPTTSVSNPAIKFPGTNTGIYSANSDTVSIGSQGSNIITFGTTGTNIPAGKSLTINSQSTFNNTATFNGTTNFKGITNLNSTTNITNPANLSGTTNLIGILNINGTTSITGQANLNGNTNLSGTTTLSGPLNITGATTISGSTNFLTSQINLLNGGSITGPAITFNDDTTSGFYSTTGSNVSISASGIQQFNVSPTGLNTTSLSMAGDINMNGTNNITCANILNTQTINCSSAFNTNAANISGPLNVTGTSYFNGTLNSTGGTANFSGPLNVTGLATLNGGLNITGATTLNGTISCTGVSLSGNITMNSNNVTGINLLNATGVYLQPGTAALPPLTFNGNTSVGLYSTGANTINICGGGQVNATISPNGLNILKGGINYNNSAIIGPNTNINLNSNINLYIVTSPTGITYSAGNINSNPIGKTVVIVNYSNGPVNITGSNGNVPPTILLPSTGYGKMLICSNLGLIKWAYKM